MVTVQDIRLQMRLLGYNGFILTRGELKELPNLLRDGEEIKQMIYGSYDKGFGMFVATDQRLLFIDRRFYHCHFVDIPYSHINSVELDSGLVTGRVTVYSRTGDITLRGMRRSRAWDFFNYVDSRIDSE